METILEISNLYKNYGKIKAVQDLSLKITSGTVFGLLGPNGSGKTTTLGVALDVVQKTSGDYQWFGKPPTKEARKKIGAILESPAFYPYLSAVNNLKVVARIKGTPYTRIDAVIEGKRSIATELLEGGGEKLLTEMSNHELLRFVALDLNRATEA